MAAKKNDDTELDPRHKMIANRIVELRKQAGYTSQEDFAHDNSIGRMSMWRAESGKTNISMKLLYQIVDGLGVSLATFFEEMTEVYEKKND